MRVRPRASDPAPRGTGLVAAPVPKKLLSMAGVEDCYTSSRGHTRTLGNFVKPVYFALAKTYGYLSPELWTPTLFQSAPYQEHTDFLATNAILTRLREALHIDHQFAVAYSPWSSGTCERMVKEVIRSLRSILLEQRRAVSEWVDVLPAMRLVALLGRLPLCWRIRRPGSGIAMSWMVTR